MPGNTPGTTLPRGNVAGTYLIGPTLTPVLIVLNTTAEQNFTVPGLQLDDLVEVHNDVAQTAGVGIVGARVSAANTLTVMFSNNTGGSLTPAAGQYLILVSRGENTPLPNNLA